MVRYILMRILFLFLTLFIVFTILFIVARFAQLERMEVLTFRDIPFMEKLKITYQDYVSYVKNILTDWDWGTDRKGLDAWNELVKRSDLTLRLNAVAFLFYTGFGLILGIFGALYKGTLFDKALNLLFLFFSSIPAYVMIMLLILLFGYYLEWFPPYEPPASNGLFIGLKGLIIPVLAVSTYPLVQVAQLIRSEMTEAFNSDYLLLLKTKGLNQRQIVFHHLIKHSVVPVITSLVPIMLYVLGSSFIVEMVYSIKGITDWLFASLFLSSADVYYPSVVLPPMVLIGTFLTGIILFVGLLVDIVYGLMDPRITMGAKKAQMD